MSKPIVAIVGRPNVGKSTLFNALAGEKISIVEDTPGVTRDRIYADASWLDRTFTIIDTGGIEPDSGDIILSQMREQAELALMSADVVLFLVDVRQGLVDADAKVADMLRKSRKPVMLVVNKVDNFEKMMPDIYEFYHDELLPLAKAISYQECEAAEKMKEEVEKAAKVSVPFDRRRDVIIAIADPSMSADDIIGKYFKKDMTDEQRKRVADHIEKVRAEHAESLRRIHEDYRGN